MELIDFMDLTAFTDWPAGGLPFPIRKRVELGARIGGATEIAAAGRTGGRV